MPLNLRNLLPSPRRQHKTRFRLKISPCEPRLLLSAHNLAAEVAPAAHQHDAHKASPEKKPLGNFTGIWVLDGEVNRAYYLQQSGQDVSGKEMQSSFEVGSITGKVKGQKLKATITGPGLTRVVKVALNDETHFVGTHRSSIDGQKQKIEHISAEKFIT